ncbi:hypothetical protein PG990_014218 [Apiospora arundinis]
MPDQTDVPSPINSKLPEMMTVEHAKRRWEWKGRLARFISGKSLTLKPEQHEGKDNCVLSTPTFTDSPAVAPDVAGPADEVESDVEDARFKPGVAAGSPEVCLVDPPRELDVASATERTQGSARPSFSASTSPASELSTFESPNTSARSYATDMGSTPTVEELEVCQIEKGVFVAPKRPVPSDHIDKWNAIQPRLEDVLLNLFKPKPGLDPSLSLEFIMAGPTRALLKPSIVMTCCNEPNRKRIKKLLKSQEWLIDSSYSLVVIVDPIHQLSLISQYNELSQSNSLCKQAKLSIILSLCGYSLYVALRMFLEHELATIYHHIGAHLIVFLLSGIIAASIHPLAYVSSHLYKEYYPIFKEWLLTVDNNNDHERGLSGPEQRSWCADTRNMEMSSMPTTDPDDSKGELSPPDMDLNCKPDITLNKQTSPDCKSSLGVYIHPLSSKGCTCGEPALVRDVDLNQAYFTIGGKILIDDDNDAENPPDEFESDSDTTSESESASPWLLWNQDDDADITALEAPSTLFQSSEDVDYDSSSSNMSSSSTYSLEVQIQRQPISELLSQAEMIGTVKNFPRDIGHQAQGVKKLDWAIIELNNIRGWTANKAATDNSSTPKEIVDVADTAQLEDGEVTVVAGYTVTSRGWLKQIPIMLRLGCHTYQAHQILLENRLVRGDSGAWVIRDGMLCGHIIAQRSLSPIAYMLPAQSIIEDIKKFMKTNNVRLPGNDTGTEAAANCNNLINTPSHTQEEPEFRTAVNLSDTQPSMSTQYAKNEEGSDQSNNLGTLIDEGYSGFQPFKLFSSCRRICYQYIYLFAQEA